MTCPISTYFYICSNSLDERADRSADAYAEYFKENPDLLINFLNVI